MKKWLLFALLAGCTSGNSGIDNSPHALGTIILGEHHPPGGGSSSPIVSASFIPDAQIGACQGEVAGCLLQLAPTCMPGCAFDEVCSFDDACNPYCKKLCTKACSTGEVCVLDAANQPACVLRESFDAGPLAFSGTTTAITLFPPYAYTAQQQGAPFLAGAQLEVQAQGAAGAGFEAFDEKFTATTFFQSLVALDKIPRETVFGTGSVPIDWAAGGDRVVIQLAGAGGTVICNANDAAGHYDVARAAVDAAVGKGTSLSLTVQRQREEIKKGKKTIGPLASAFVQPQGWVDLITMSQESASFTGCGAGMAACGTGGVCADLTSDSQNCGGCGVKCATSQVCVASQCTNSGDACDACYSSSMTGGCRTQYNACLADAECAALNTCLDGCTDATCQQDCVTQHSAGQSKLNSFITCVCNTACMNECAMQC